VQQDQVVTTAVKAVGGQMYLLRLRQVDESGAAERLGSKLPSAFADDHSSAEIRCSSTAGGWLIPPSCPERQPHRREKRHSG